MTEQELQILEGMLSRIEQCEETNRLLMKVNKELVRGNQVLSESMDALRYEYECYVENSRYELLDPRIVEQITTFPKIHSIDDTLCELFHSEKSLCRFGDGEFACISGNLRAGFTSKYNSLLAERLKEVLSSCDDDIMIAIADNYGDLSGYIPQSRREIRSYMSSEVRREHMELLDADRIYYNAYITRPFMFREQDSEHMKLYFNRFKQLWSRKSVVIIEGVNTGFGVGNDLLNDCSEVGRIIAPAVDAFEKYQDIFNAARSQDNGSLYLIALGPTATVLAYDLAKCGRRAIDIGHLDIEYEWMVLGKYRSSIPNKYVNEVQGGTMPEPITDKAYLNQIIENVC